MTRDSSSPTRGRSSIEIRRARARHHTPWRVLKITTEDRRLARGSLLWIDSLVNVAKGLRSRPFRTSAAQAETLDDRAVALDLGLLQVVQQPAALTHQQQQATTAVVVVLVLLEVLGEVGDAVAEQRDLDLGGTGVALGRGVLGDDLLLGLRVGTDRHAGLLSILVARRAGACSPGHW